MAVHILSYIIYFILFFYSGTNPSGHWVKGGGLLGQVASLSQEHFPLNMVQYTVFIPTALSLSSFKKIIDNMHHSKPFLNIFM